MKQCTLGSGGKILTGFSQHFHCNSACKTFSTLKSSCRIALYSSPSVFTNIKLPCPCSRSAQHDTAATMFHVRDGVLCVFTMFPYMSLEMCKHRKTFCSVLSPGSAKVAFIILFIPIDPSDVSEGGDQVGLPLGSDENSSLLSVWVKLQG